MDVSRRDRVGVGIRVLGDSVSIDPCIPRGWRGFEVTLRHCSATYEITVTNPFGLNRGISHAELDDGSLLRAPLIIPLKDDGAVHGVRVVMGRSESDEHADDVTAPHMLLLQRLKDKFAAVAGFGRRRQVDPVLIFSALVRMTEGPSDGYHAKRSPDA